MDWMIAGITVLGVFIANAALIIPLFLWNRAERKADIKYMDSKLESNSELVRSIYDEIRSITIYTKNEFSEKLENILRKKGNPDENKTYAANALNLLTSKHYRIDVLNKYVEFVPIDGSGYGVEILNYEENEFSEKFDNILRKKRFYRKARKKIFTAGY